MKVYKIPAQVFRFDHSLKGMGISILLAFAVPINAASADYLFAPSGCEYTVVFKRSPRLYEMNKADARGVLYPLFGTERTVTDGDRFVRAECMVLDYIDQTQLTNVVLLTWMTQIARDLGLSRPAFKHERGSLGVVGTILGVKSSEGGQLTTQVVNYHGFHSVLTVYIVGVSTDWQTPQMARFLESVARNRNGLAD